MSFSITANLIGTNSTVLSQNQNQLIFKSVVASYLKGRRTNVMITAIRDDRKSRHLVSDSSRLTSFSFEAIFSSLQSLSSRWISGKASSKTIAFQNNQNNNHSRGGKDESTMHRDLALIATVTTSVDMTVSVIVESLGLGNSASAFSSLSSTLTSTSTVSSITSDLRAATKDFSSVAVASVTPDPASVTTELVHTAHPTSSPTSSPTCQSGSFGKPGQCGPCPPGYSSPHGSESCIPCPKGMYSKDFGTKECSVCPWPTYTNFEGNSDCLGFNFQLRSKALIIVVAFLLAAFLFTIYFANEKRLVVASLFILPVLDFTSDVAYFLSSPFAGTANFALCALAFAFPNTLIFWKMSQIGAGVFIFNLFPGFKLFTKPRLLWLGVSAGRPAINGERISIVIFGETYPLTFDNHDTLLKAGLYILSWALMLGLQTIFFMCFFIWFGISLMYLVPVILFGTFAIQCKVNNRPFRFVIFGSFWYFYQNQLLLHERNILSSTLPPHSPLSSLIFDRSLAYAPFGTRTFVFCLAPRRK